jgi:DNA-binding NarL/FixJ family response regulator
MASNLFDDTPIRMRRCRSAECPADSGHGLDGSDGFRGGAPATPLSANGKESQHTREIRVLISHCDPVISAGLQAVLYKRCDVRVVASGLDNDPGHRPIADVVIADHESGMRVIESERELRGRVVILTHNDSEVSICHALERGAGGYLLLGCSLETLVEGIKSVYRGGVALGPVVARRIAENMKQQPLTAREQDVLQQLLTGASNKKIATELALKLGTVKQHVKSILEKLHATSRTEAVAIAHRRGLLP